MLSTERADFESNLATLCAGFNVPTTSERIDAYWRGLAKMPLPAFARLVDHALSEDGPDKIPTSQQCWTLHRHLRAKQRDLERVPLQGSIAPVLDALAMHSNRVLLSFLRHQDTGASQASLLRMIAAKNKLVEQYRWITQDEPQAALELRDKLWAEFAELWEPIPEAQQQRHIDAFQHTGSTSPFTESELAHLRAGTAP